MRTLRLITGLIVLAAATSTLAKADDIFTFDIVGSGLAEYDFDPSVLFPAPQPTVSGSFTYDFTTYTVLSSTVSLTDGYLDVSSYFTPTQYVTCPEYNLCYYGCDMGNLTTDGGSFSIGASGYFETPSGEFSEDVFYDGIISPGVASSVTPEPSSFALLGTGLVIVAGRWRKRFNE